MRIPFVVLALSLAVLFSCGTGEDDKTFRLDVPTHHQVEVNALMNRFSEAWNRKDSAALMGLFSNDIVVLIGRKRLSGKDSVAETLLHAKLPLTANLRITEVQSGAGPEVAYSAGTWTLNVSAPGQPTTVAAGNHNFIWEYVAPETPATAGSDSAWRLTLVSIESYSSP